MLKKYVKVVLFYLVVISVALEQASAKANVVEVCEDETLPEICPTELNSIWDSGLNKNTTPAQWTVPVATSTDVLYSTTVIPNLEKRQMKGGVKDLGGKLGENPTSSGDKLTKKLVCSLDDEMHDSNQDFGGQMVCPAMQWSVRNYKAELVPLPGGAPKSRKKRQIVGQRTPLTEEELGKLRQRYGNKFNKRLEQVKKHMKNRYAYVRIPPHRQYLNNKKPGKLFPKPHVRNPPHHLPPHGHPGDPLYLHRPHHTPLKFPHMGPQRPQGGLNPATGYKRPMKPNPRLLNNGQRPNWMPVQNNKFQQRPMRLPQPPPPQFVNGPQNYPMQFPPPPPQNPPIQNQYYNPAVLYPSPPPQNPPIQNQFYSSAILYPSPPPQLQNTPVLFSPPAQLEPYGLNPNVAFEPRMPHFGVGSPDDGALQQNFAPRNQEPAHPVDYSNPSNFEPEISEPMATQEKTDQFYVAEPPQMQPVANEEISETNNYPAEVETEAPWQPEEFPPSPPPLEQMLPTPHPRFEEPPPPRLEQEQYPMLPDGQLPPLRSDQPPRPEPKLPPPRPDQRERPPVPRFEQPPKSEPQSRPDPSLGPQKNGNRPPIPPGPGNQRGKPGPGNQRGPLGPGNQREPPGPENQRGPPGTGNQRGPPGPGNQRGPPGPGNQRGPPGPGNQRGPAGAGNQRGPAGPGNQRGPAGPGNQRGPPGPPLPGSGPGRGPRPPPPMMQQRRPPGMNLPENGGMPQPPGRPGQNGPRYPRSDGAIQNAEDLDSISVQDYSVSLLTDRECSLHGTWYSSSTGLIITLTTLEDEVLVHAEQTRSSIFDSVNHWKGIAVLSPVDPTSITLIFQKEHLPEDEYNVGLFSVIFVGECVFCDSGNAIQGTWTIFPENGSCLPGFNNTLLY